MNYELEIENYTNYINKKTENHESVRLKSDIIMFGSVGFGVGLAFLIAGLEIAEVISADMALGSLMALVVVIVCSLLFGLVYYDVKSKRVNEEIESNKEVSKEFERLTKDLRRTDVVEIFNYLYKSEGINKKVYLTQDGNYKIIDCDWDK